MSHNLAARMVLPWTRREWKGSWRLLDKLKVAGPAHDDRWRGFGERLVRGRWHGYRMIVDPADWAERLTYFTARYYDTKTQLALMRLLRPGDRFVDIGANNGMMSLLAAKLVGKRGLVDAFEPHPHCVQRIARQIELNALDHLRLHPVALGETNASAALHVKPQHTGYSTLADVDDQQHGTRSVNVDVRRGDDELRHDPRPVRLIKIDVEGYEAPALRGLAAFLASDRPAVLAEINPHCLRLAGMTPDDVMHALTSRGYRGQRLDGRGEELTLSPLDETWDRSTTIDTVWFHADADAADGEHRLHAA